MAKKKRTAKRARAEAGGRGAPAARTPRGRRPHWSLRLYVAGRSPKSELARANLKRLCEHHLPGHYTIEVVDLLADPRQAKIDQVLAIPTLVRRHPVPVKRLIGDLSDVERTIAALGLPAGAHESS